MWVNWGKGDDIPRANYAHRKSVEPVRPQVSWNVCRTPTKMPTSLGTGLYCCCLIAWAVVHRNGGSPSVFVFSPMAAFLPLFYLPISLTIPLILSFAAVSGGPCHFKNNSLSLYSGKPVSDSTKIQYYLAIWIMVEKVLVGSYIKHLEWPCCPMKFENRDSGVTIQWHWLSCISIERSYSIIPNSSCFSSSMRSASHRRMWHINPSPSSPLFFPHKILNQSFYDVGQSQTFFSWG